MNNTEDEDDAHGHLLYNIGYCDGVRRNRLLKRIRIQIMNSLCSLSSYR